MIVRRTATRHVVISAAVMATLAGCAATPMGPTIQVLPGRGKSFDTFQADQAGCKTYAANQVKGQADAANNRAVGAALLTTALGAATGAAVGGSVGDAANGAAVGAATGAGGGAVIGATGSANEQAGIQQQYDNAFAQCMYAKGEQVPGYAPVAVAAPGPVSAADPLVRSIQGELNRLGYLQGGADGYIGPKTRGAISSFEQATGLPVDGSPSPRLLARLQSTPTHATAAAAPTAAAPGNWVAPTGSPSAAPAPAAAAPSGWVAPAKTP